MKSKWFIVTCLLLCALTPQISARPKLTARQKIQKLEKKLTHAYNEIRYLENRIDQIVLKETELETQLMGIKSNKDSFKKKHTLNDLEESVYSLGVQTRRLIVLGILLYLTCGLTFFYAWRKSILNNSKKQQVH